eukprot:scaffold75867_cov34-Phaeocystis_antarctica.AAC.1
MLSVPSLPSLKLALSTFVGPDELDDPARAARAGSARVAGPAGVRSRGRWTGDGRECIIRMMLSSNGCRHRQYQERLK